MLIKLLDGTEQNCRLVSKDVGKLVPVTKRVELHNYKFAIQHVVLGGRAQNFPVGYSTGCKSVPILPFGVLAYLVVLRHHNRHHRDVDTTVVFIRSEIWPVRAWKIPCQDKGLRSNKWVIYLPSEEKCPQVFQLF